MSVSICGYFYGVYLVVSKEHLKESGEEVYYRATPGFLVGGVDSMNQGIEEQIEKNIIYPVKGDVLGNEKEYKNHHELMADLKLLWKQ